MNLIGYHLATQKNMCASLEDTVRNKIGVIQIFLSNNKSFNKCTKKESDIIEFGKICQDNDIKIFVHAPYVINLSKNDKLNLSKCKNLLRDLLQKSDLMCGKGVIIHLGKALDLDEHTAVSNFVDNVSDIIKNTSFKSKLILEISSGQGTEICHNISDFLDMFDSFKHVYKQKLGICIDTCHIFASGHDIRNKCKIISFFDKLKKHTDYISCFHLNDSKKNFGERKDRHEDIGYGFIGLENLHTIYTLCKKLNIPMILETPTANCSYIEQINNVIKN